MATTELYQAALAAFGGVTSPLPTDASALHVFTWFKDNIAKLPDFVRGAMDFGALSCATNLCKTLRKLGCAHFAELISRREFDGPLELGRTMAEVSRPVRNFMKYFWLTFGRADARLLVEARHVAVSDACILLFYCISRTSFYLRHVLSMTCRRLGWDMPQKGRHQRQVEH